MEQIARNLVDAFDGFLQGKRYLLTDRDPLYAEGSLGFQHATGLYPGASKRNLDVLLCRDVRRANTSTHESGLRSSARLAT